MVGQAAVVPCWCGPSGEPKFELIEFWIENRVMIAIATKDMVLNYVRTTTEGAETAYQLDLRRSLRRAMRGPEWQFSGAHAIRAKGWNVVVSGQAACGRTCG